MFQSVPLTNTVDNVITILHNGEVWKDLYQS